jgi:glycerol-3-phosphate acyltransferase PlsY
MFWLILICSAVVSYLLGGVNGAIITSKYYYHKDIRQYGSGNAGLTNFCRVFGKYGAVLVIVIDVMKTVLPVLATALVLDRLYGNWQFGAAWSGLFVMIGHSYPAYYKFKGGKTVLAAGTMVWFVDWKVGLTVWVVFLLCVIITRYVSLGSVASAVAYPIAIVLFTQWDWRALTMAIVSAALLIVRHRANIKRLIMNQESKLSFKK